MAAEWKTGDTTPNISGVVRDANGPVDIHSAAGVRFIATCPDREGAIEGEVDVIDDGTVETRGMWEYEWAVDDLDTAGTYESEIEVTWSEGTPDKIETFPNNKGRNPTFLVTPDLD